MYVPTVKTDRIAYLRSRAVFISSHLETDFEEVPISIIMVGLSLDRAGDSLSHPSFSSYTVRKKGDCYVCRKTCTSKDKKTQAFLYAALNCMTFLYFLYRQTDIICHSN